MALRTVRKKLGSIANANRGLLLESLVIATVAALLTESLETEMFSSSPWPFNANSTLSRISGDDSFGLAALRKRRQRSIWKTLLRLLCT